MKRIALCLYGKFNNRLSPTSGTEGFQYIHKKILENRHVDVFIHSWDEANKDLISELYSPWLKESLFEAQKDFSAEILAAGVRKEDFHAPGGESFRTLENSLSFFYSRARSIQEKKSYEDSHGFKYDVVICSRFDLGQMDKYNGFQDHKVSEIVFDENLDMSYLYSAMWYLFNEGFTDMWFYSSSEVMDTLIEMYPKALGYYRKDSGYVKALTEGWPDSNRNDIFSNEMFKPDEMKATEKMVYRYSDAQNNHFLHKWFLIDTGLYRRCRFLSVLGTRFCKLVYSENEAAFTRYAEASSHYSKVMGPQFVLAPEKYESLPKGYQWIPYTRDLSYAESLKVGLKKIEEQGFEALLLEHESTVLVAPVDYYRLKSAVSMVLKARRGRPFRNGFDYLSLRPDSRSFSIGSWTFRHVRWVSNILFVKRSLHPSLWKVQSLQKALKNVSRASLRKLDRQLWFLSLKYNFKSGFVCAGGMFFVRRNKPIYHATKEIN